MLSRVAEALFWVGRYVERAEDTARLLDVHFHEVLEDPGVDEAHACAVLLSVMGVPADTAGKHRDSSAVLELLGYAEGSSSSIVGALAAAWQNARSAREALSADIWECLNSTHTLCKPGWPPPATSVRRRSSLTSASARRTLPATSRRA